MNSRKREDNGLGKRKHWIAFCGEFALVEVMHMSKDRPGNIRL
jgi:hypothetical protein